MKFIYEMQLYMDDMWNAVRAGKKQFNDYLHIMKNSSRILSWSRYGPSAFNPFQCNLGYQVSLSGKEWKKNLTM